MDQGYACPELKAVNLSSVARPDRPLDFLARLNPDLMLRVVIAVMCTDTLGGLSLSTYNSGGEPFVSYVERFRAGVRQKTQVEYLLFRLRCLLSFGNGWFQKCRSRRGGNSMSGVGISMTSLAVFVLATFGTSALSLLIAGFISVAVGKRELRKTPSAETASAGNSFRQ
jgi:hypothetical protein